MVVKCVECGGKVSSEAESCPHCGAPVSLSLSGSPRRRRKEMADADEEERDEEETSSPPPSGESFDFPAFLVRVLKGCFFLLALLVIFSAMLFFSIRYDVGGFRSALRKIADSDSGTGSHVDRSNSRVMFKYYLGNILDSLEGKQQKKGSAGAAGSGKDAAPELPEKNAETVPAPTQPAGSSATSERPGEPAVFDRVERKPVELPPPPPEE